MMIRIRKVEEKDIECPVCGRELDDTDKIEMVDMESKVFKCSDCGVRLEYDEALKAVYISAILTSLAL